MTARRRQRPASEGPLAVIDIGSAKMTTLIAHVGEDGRFEVTGIGHRQSEGIKAGFVVDMAAAAHALRASVDQAERLAGVPVERAIVSVNIAPMVNASTVVALALNGAEVTPKVIERLHQAARLRFQRWLQGAQAEDGAEIAVAGSTGEPGTLAPLHLRPVLWRLDEVDSPHAPIGLKGERIELAVQMLAVPRAPLANLASLVARAHLKPQAHVAAPFAAGLAALTPEERELGAAVLDIGAGRTALGIFAGGRFLHGDSLPLAGAAITRDIAEGLLVPPAQAERLKCLHGHAAAAGAGRQETIELRRIGDGLRDELVSVPVARLDAIIAARVAEILETAVERLAAGGFAGPAARRVVIVGGGAQLAGLDEALLHLRPGWSIRIGRPLGVLGLAEATQGPAFAVAAGLLKAAAGLDEEIAIDGAGPRAVPAGAPVGGLAGIGRWIRENF